MAAEIFVLIFNKPLVEQEIKNALAKIFSNEVYIIEYIYSDLKNDIFFNIHLLESANVKDDADKEKYCYELNVFLPKALLLEYGMYNDLIFALKFCSLLGEKALIYNHSDIPYLYLLVDGNEVSLVEDEEEDYCISFYTSKRKKLSLAKSLGMLPKREYYETDSEKPAFYVRNGKEWYNCIE